MGQKDPRIMGPYAGRLLIFLGRTCCALFLWPYLLSACIFGCVAGAAFLFHGIFSARASIKGYRLHQGAIKIHILDYDG
jgi:hypothetical protein